MHTSVLLKESIDFLQPEKGKYFIDATVNGGGHAEAILKRLASDGMLMGIDRDPILLEKAKRRFVTEKRFHPVHANFASIEKIGKLWKKKFDGILFDLGMSSFQLEEVQRGFSFLTDAPLDMRFDPQEKLSAESIVNTWSEEQLRTMIRQYGEERFAGRIAHTIVQERKKESISTTFSLVAVITKAIPRRFQSRRIHPATKTFQALRIAVNNELDSLTKGLAGAWDITKRRGRIAVISFHSLEDRIVKHTFRDWEKTYHAHILTKKPFIPTEEEKDINSRARSAKLRVIEK